MPPERGPFRSCGASPYEPAGGRSPSDVMGFARDAPPLPFALSLSKGTLPPAWSTGKAALRQAQGERKARGAYGPKVGPNLAPLPAPA